MKLIQRDFYLDKLKDIVGTPDIKVITGLRRSGKSKLLESFMDYVKATDGDANIIHVNFNLSEYEHLLEHHALHDYVEGAYVPSKNNYVLIDEIQMCDGFEKAINSLHASEKYDIYITGSNAKMLSGELATYLAGRYVGFTIYPFSFQEVLQALGDVPPQEAFRLYLQRGGMPFLYQFPMDEQNVRQYLDDIYSSIILKDIAQRNKIRDLELLKRVLQYFISNIGNPFSASTITRYLKNEKRKISNETLYNYIDYCKTACLLHLVPREDISGKQLLQFQEKIYLTDHGFREALLGTNLRDINQVLENIVYLELLRRGYTVTVGRLGRSEVDLVAKQGKDTLYIQVSYLLASEDTVQREFSVLEKIPDNYPKYVVTMDEIDRGRNGIKHVHIRDFLLMDRYG